MKQINSVDKIDLIDGLIHMNSQTEWSNTLGVLPVLTFPDTVLYLVCLFLKKKEKKIIIKKLKSLKAFVVYLYMYRKPKCDNTGMNQCTANTTPLLLSTVILLHWAIGSSNKYIFKH